VLEGPRRPGDPPALIADPKLAETLLGWTARHSDLQTIVRTAWQWHQTMGVKATRSDRKRRLTLASA
jgi:UDP-glucose 4-epimerase